MLTSYYLTISSDADFPPEVEHELYRRIKTSNGIRKSTEPHRLDLINDLLFTTLDRLKLIPRSVMDIGVSSGITTLEWMHEFDRRGLAVTMTATDLVMKVYMFQVSKNIRVLTEASGHLLQLEIFGKPFYTYRRRRDYFTGGLIWRRALCEMVRSRLSKCVPQGPFYFVTPTLRSQDRIVLLEDNILSPSPPEILGCADIVRVANLIQPLYFTGDEIRRSVQTIRERCRGENSLVIVCRNRFRGLEGSIFRLTDRDEFVVEARLGPGSEVEQFFTNRF